MNTDVDLAIAIPGYFVLEEIYHGSKTVVYRAVRETDQQRVVIKLLKREYPNFSELLQFRNQYAIARQIVVEKYGGAIEVNSTLGQGTEFVIILPITAEIANEYR